MNIELSLFNPEPISANVEKDNEETFSKEKNKEQIRENELEEIEKANENVKTCPYERITCFIQTGKFIIILIIFLRDIIKIILSIFKNILKIVKNLLETVLKIFKYIVKICIKVFYTLLFKQLIKILYIFIKFLYSVLKIVTKFVFKTFKSMVFQLSKLVKFFVTRVISCISYTMELILAFFYQLLKSVLTKAYEFLYLSAWLVYKILVLFPLRLFRFILNTVCTFIKVIFLLPWKVVKSTFSVSVKFVRFFTKIIDKVLITPFKKIFNGLCYLIGLILSYLIGPILSKFTCKVCKNGPLLLNLLSKRKDINNTPQEPAEDWKVANFESVTIEVEGDRVEVKGVGIEVTYNTTYNNNNNTTLPYSSKKPFGDVIIEIAHNNHITTKLVSRNKYVGTTHPKNLMSGNDVTLKKS
uniref:Uncharacterized protein n=1 Tax=Cacopsylla melanoneura TaxID=428564 RepID=A0A8D8WXH3_9HEMI